ncbi:hypothetical protein [Nostoc sp. FACHB-190]|uniref:hypothetical protein n=1 Tax=Nostoc sp. FACHB-190 TaxID=2692838 RepID=UPI0016850962|nr:hypothetical protein [Nostoc sp. FACHB-190]MBD2297451.1 hypothetical protein [Nostoc sp. FACHB-190]
MIKTKALVIAVSGVLAFYGNAAIATTNQDITLRHNPAANEEEIVETTPQFPSKHVSEGCLVNGKWVPC